MVCAYIVYISNIHYKYNVLKKSGGSQDLGGSQKIWGGSQKIFGGPKKI